MANQNRLINYKFNTEKKLAQRKRRIHFEIYHVSVSSAHRTEPICCSANYYWLLFEKKNNKKVKVIQFDLKSTSALHENSCAFSYIGRENKQIGIHVKRKSCGNKQTKM